MAHQQLTGHKREVGFARDYFNACNDAARALAQLAEIFHVDEAGRLQGLPPDEIEVGQFDNGGDILRMPSGTVYRQLSVRRIDVMDGIVALKAGLRALEKNAVRTESG